ncbi:MAG: tRNA uridine-5-carboxymethylaminomethyl(34) synthesis GTPase MnmE [Acholeplasmatales bacterium]|nr:tRNA uridine-5-carboxymethylaminomethyl(34) synthesis GTPase MnmE [Acholeplasmatales bacterium]
MVDDICAIATPYGVGAISIIRCSGPEAIIKVNNIFKGKDLTKVKGRTINYGFIMDKGVIIDEVLANVYHAPHSFDGENMVELNCHGGIYVTNRVLETLLQNGFRLAERGEFSKRGFLNHKMDLTEAESIMDLISSNNELALISSNKSLRSSTHNLIKSLRDELLDIIAKIEVNIDYPEYEDSVDVTNSYITPIIDRLMDKMEKIIENSKVSNIVIHGVKTAIIGKPNVGKSSLLNLLLDEEKAIVSNVAGTTRDIVEGVIKINNATLHLIDTAGIHESDDMIENLGIKKSERAINEADLIILMLDVSKPLDKDDHKILEETKDKKRIIIANKIDLVKNWELDDVLYLSMNDKKSIDILSKKIEEVLKINEFNTYNDLYLNNVRQIDLMKKALESLKQAKMACDNLYDVALIEIDIKKSFDLLGEITGESNPDELVTALFTKFCLGK